MAGAKVQRSWSWEEVRQERSNNKREVCQGAREVREQPRRSSCLAKTKRNNAKIIHVITKRIGRGGNETMENLDLVRKRHGSSVCTKRGQATSAVEDGSKTTKTNTRRTVEK